MILVDPEEILALRLALDELWGIIDNPISVTRRTEKAAVANHWHLAGYPDDQIAQMLKDRLGLAE